jgi:hypothetical protein
MSTDLQQTPDAPTHTEKCTALWRRLIDLRTPEGKRPLWWKPGMVTDKGHVLTVYQGVLGYWHLFEYQSQGYEAADWLHQPVDVELDAHPDWDNPGSIGHLAAMTRELYNGIQVDVNPPVDVNSTWSWSLHSRLAIHGWVIEQAYGGRGVQGAAGIGGLLSESEAYAWLRASAWMLHLQWLHAPTAPDTEVLIEEGRKATDALVSSVSAWDAVVNVKMREGFHMHGHLTDLRPTSKNYL